MALNYRLIIIFLVFEKKNVVENEHMLKLILFTYLCEYKYKTLKSYVSLAFSNAEI